MKYDALLQYLEARRGREPGWIPEYETSNLPDASWAFKVGHYERLLMDLIDAIGQERVERLLYALSEIEERIAHIEQSAEGKRE